MICTLHLNDQYVTFPSIALALDELEHDCAELDNLSGLFMTSASGGSESNVNVWMAFGSHDSIDYPDEVWSVVPRRTPCPWTGRWWRIARQRA